MSALAGVGEGLPITAFGPMIRELGRLGVKDKRYQRCPVGSQVGRYVRSLQFAGAASNTVESYEQVLAWLSLDHADFDSLERFCAPDGPEYLEEFLIRHWADAAEKTRAQRRTILNVFFAWALDKGLVPFNPMATVKGPRAPRTQTEREAYERETVLQLIHAQPTLRDQCALGLTRLGLRREDLRLLQLGDIDLTRDAVRLRHGKGGRRARLPLVFADLRHDLHIHLLERSAATDGSPDGEFLLYPRNDRGRAMGKSSIHRWFKRCLANAGLPASIKLHELRHSAGTEIWRQTGNLVLAQQLLRHRSVGTTQAYLHPTDEDLRAGLRLVDEAWRNDE